MDYKTQLETLERDLTYICLELSRIRKERLTMRKASNYIDYKEAHDRFPVYKEIYTRLFNIAQKPPTRSMYMTYFEEKDNEFNDIEFKTNTRITKKQMEINQLREQMLLSSKKLNDENN